MLPFPTPKPTGHPSTQTVPLAQPILPLHATDKPLPPPPAPPSSRTRTTSSESDSGTQRGIRGWWKRNRQRAGGGASPGQAELGVPTTCANERTGSDVEALTVGLSRVTFGRETARRDPEQNVHTHKDWPSSSTRFAVHSLPPMKPRAVVSESQRRLCPPVYAPHVEEERIHHSASAPQLEVPSRLQGQHQENDPFLYYPSHNTSHRKTTFEPDSRTLERLPDRPATSISPSKHTSALFFSQPTRIIPSLPTTPRTHPHHPLTPSHKPNSPLTVRQPPPLGVRTPGHSPTVSSRRVITSPSSELAVTPIKSPGGGTSVQCSGFTQRGQRCKKRVKAVAPYYTTVQRNRGSGWDGCADGVDVVVVEEDEKRFCKVHVGQICSPEGFYAKQSGGAAPPAARERWIQFSDYIPHDLEEQTKALLRLTMESPLSPNESAGYIYAYELRDISTEDVGYYKVGRTDNVPRRLKEWSKQCASHRPTLRDIFPQREASRDKATEPLSEPRSSVLPGAMANQGAQCPAVKRLEKLIHIELSARQVMAIGTLTTPCVPSLISPSLHTGRPCPDCSTMHREIFAIPRRGTGIGEGKEYETVVRPVIWRWQRFIEDTML
ncbi:hypothetical protein NliqN6_0619 [Naganishia liquefaciens]|uniref:Bacteriophage T5 Orf172 DNA-binding domain-containing protein n=1 Tax=Naganishia liquefaciens TaxID=104408 RepID=A0A8H3TNB7_9TREE|nr:hypothetical protein NliqN6_0619 [Naganishia liquefaciens]